MSYGVVCSSDEEMEEATPIEANDSDYDPNKEAKKEVRVKQRPCVTQRFKVLFCIPVLSVYYIIFYFVTIRTRWSRRCWALRWLWVDESTRPCSTDTTSAPAADPPKACT